MTAAITELLDIMVRLRDTEHGCPWDRQQDFSSIAPYTLEEAYEVADAIARDNMADLREELGDLLFQVVFHARIAEEAGEFDFEDLTRGIADKLVRRHPHVFAKVENLDVAAQSERWEALKAGERSAKTAQALDAGVLAGVALALPALLRAAKLQKRASRIGFDWPDIRGPLAKIHEELAEVEAELDTDSHQALEMEIGDLLFAVVNLARHAGIDAEAALRGANDKFVRRFQAMEEQLGSRLPEAGLEEMEAVWQSVKQNRG